MLDETCLYNCLCNILFFRYGLFTAANFNAAANALINLFASNYFSDADDIATYGANSISLNFTQLGVTQMDAAQNFIALVSLGTLPSGDGSTWTSRGDYLYFLGLTLAQILDPNNVPGASAMGIDFTAMNNASPVDKLAALGVTLLDLRTNNPDAFAPLEVSLSLRHYLDNLYQFDVTRNALQSTVPATTPPTFVTSINASGAPALANFTQIAFGTAYPNGTF